MSKSTDNFKELPSMMASSFSGCLLNYVGNLLSKEHEIESQVGGWLRVASTRPAHKCGS